MLEILENGSVARLLLTVGVWAALLFLYITRQTVDENLLHAGLLILGFYFGSTISNGKTVRKVVSTDQVTSQPDK